ncbi:MAG: hypothetical protein IT497_10305 [Ottowia sp.]|nr:hypothetical protein [Ottowia sp.]
MDTFNSYAQNTNVENLSVEEKNISPGAFRRYTVGVLNKANELSPGKIPEIERYKPALSKDDCINILLGDMEAHIKSSARNDGVL